MKHQIKKIILLIFLSCLSASPLLASNPVTVVIEETVIAEKTTIFVYGYAEGVDRRQKVSVTLRDKNGQRIELDAKINNFGNWGVEGVDIGTLSDGTITITAMLKDDTGKTMAQATATAVLDTSFSVAAFLNQHFAGAIFLLMVMLLLLGFPMKIPLIAGATLGVYLLYNGDLSQMQFVIQQMMAGIRPAALIAVPMFILSADIMTRGKSAEKLIDLVM
ncbi:MAG TPA: TRAP transporter large permease subunit, partial [Desulfotignum sp.]|nr:TRAP transporter large permease subunit [Desulfotignum sp.]